MKNQVLSIEQIFKLQNLGFDVIKNSSSIVIIKENGPFIVSKEMVEKNIFGITDKIEDMFYSMTIEDLYNALPYKILYKSDYGLMSYHLEVRKEINTYKVRYIYEDSFGSKLFFTPLFKDKYLINTLYNQLIWILSNQDQFKILN